jgi:hypothetical protein
MPAPDAPSRPVGLLDPVDVALATYLADAGRILGSSLDSAATLRQIADLIVPGVADWCYIDMLDAEGRLTPLVIAHRDPDRVRLVEELRSKYASRPVRSRARPLSRAPARRWSSRSSTTR